MSDNYVNGSLPKVTCDEVTYSGDVAQLQLIRLVYVAGTEGAKTVVDVPASNANGLTVDVTRVQGTVTISGTVTGANTAGDIAHDGVDSGNPVKTGGRAISALSGATMVAAGDRADHISDIDGVQVVKQGCPLGDILSERVTDTGGTSTASTVFGATASTRNFITTIVVYNDSSTNGFVDIRDGVAGSVLLTLPLPAKGGCVINLPVPLRQPTANTALAFDVSAALTTVYLSFIGFKSKA